MLARRVAGVGILERGSGRPFTLFAPGGRGAHLDRRMRYADKVPGTKVGFAYEASRHFEAIRRIRRQADRDASEARAVAIDCEATQAIGFSRGARAVIGALAEDPALFERVVLVMPPGGQAAGKYSTWLASLTSTGRDGLTAEILVVGQRGDQGHPARVAEVWSERLGARLEILPPRAIQIDSGRAASLLAEFLS